MKRVLALIAAGVIAATIAGGASAKGGPPSKTNYTSDIFLILSNWNFSQVVTEKGLGKAPVTFSSTANGLEEFFCTNGSLAGQTTWNASDQTTVTPDKGKATGSLLFQRPQTESTFTCADGSTPIIGYILYSNISVTDNYGNPLTIPDQSQGTPA